MTTRIGPEASTMGISFEESPFLRKATRQSVDSEDYQATVLLTKDHP
jgi:hypothetical protein